MTREFRFCTHDVRRRISLGVLIALFAVMASTPVSADLLKRGYTAVEPPLAPGERLLKPMTIDVKVSAQGEVIATRTDGSVPASVAELLVKAVKRWSFDPSRRDGQPVEDATRITLSLIAVPVASGVSLRVSRVDLTSVWLPDTANLVAPRYPSSVRRRKDTSVLVLAEPEVPSGKLKVLATWIDGAPSKSGDPYANAARVAIANWTIEVLEWDGVKYPNLVCVPVDFSWGDAPSQDEGRNSSEDACKGMTDDKQRGSIELTSKVVGQML